MPSLPPLRSDRACWRLGQITGEGSALGAGRNRLLKLKSGPNQNALPFELLPLFAKNARGTAGRRNQKHRDKPPATRALSRMYTPERRLPIGDWWLVVGGGWRLAIGDGWRLAAVAGWQLVVSGGWRLAVGGRWRLAVGGGWWSLGAVLKGGFLKDQQGIGTVTMRDRVHGALCAWGPIFGFGIGGYVQVCDTALLPIECPPFSS